jgi:hypothetical protein
VVRSEAYGKKTYVIDGVHGNTTSLGPGVALDSELVLGTGSLQEGLVGTATTGDDTNHTTGSVLDDLLGTGGELDAGLAILGVVANNGNVVAGGTAERTAVTNLLLDVGDDGTLGHGGEGKNVADGQGGVLTGVDELAGVHALVGDEGLGDHLELVGVTELDLGEGSTTAGIVDDLLDDTTGVSVTLGVVEGTELRRSLVETGVGRYRQKNSKSALPFPLFVCPDSRNFIATRSVASTKIGGRTIFFFDRTH